MSREWAGLIVVLLAAACTGTLGPRPARATPDADVALYRRAFLSSLEDRDTLRAADFLTSLALSFHAAGQADSAALCVRRSMKFRRALGDTTDPSGGLRFLQAGMQAAMERKPNSFGRVVGCFRASALLYDLAGDRRANGVTLFILGDAFDKTGYPDSAESCFRRSSEVQHSIADHEWEGKALGRLARMLFARGALDSSMACYRRGLEASRRAGDAGNQQEMLQNIGATHFLRGEPDSSEVAYRTAARIAQAARDTAGEVKTWTSLASIELRSGRPDSALASYGRALALTKAMGDRRGEGEVLISIGETHYRLSGLGSAMASYREALSVLRSAGDESGQATALNDLGAAHHDLGRVDSAVVYYRSALALQRAVGDHRAEGSTLTNIGGAFEDLDQPDSALTYYREGLAPQRATFDRANEGVTLGNMGSIFVREGLPDSALVYYRSALAVRREAFDRAGEAVILSKMGQAFEGAGQPDSALRSYRDALRGLRAAGRRGSEAITLADLGTHYHRAARVRDLGRAVAYYDSAAALSAALAGEAGADADRVSFNERLTAVYEDWALAWLERADEVGTATAAQASLAATERGRAQALLKLMKGHAPGADWARDLPTEGRELSARAAAAGVAVLEYFVTRDTLLVWLVQPGGSAGTVFRRGISRDTLVARVARYRTAMGVGAWTESRLAVRGSPPLERSQLVLGLASTADAVGPDLAELLLPPGLEKRLGAVTEIAIVAHGPLELVPFGALRLPSGDPLGIRYSLRYAPSLTSLLAAQDRTPVLGPDLAHADFRKALVVGNPAMPTIPMSDGSSIALQPLAGAEAEGREVARLLGVTPLTGSVAMEESVRQRLDVAPIVHLATHGYAYASEALVRNSFVALAPGLGQDGLLTVGEILDDPNLRLRADLVVLSACQSGLGNLRQAEGTVGLQRAFLAKGARTVLVSLWNVSDEATTLLMKGFYTHWLNDPDHPGKAEALRRAQADVRGQPGSKFYQPRYWAAFQLVGAS